MSTDGGASWKGVSAIVNINTTENTATATVGSLTGGIGYNFRVAAETTAGTGVFSVRSNLVVPSLAAPAPLVANVNSTAEGGDGETSQTYNTPNEELGYVFTYDSLAIPDAYRIQITAGGQELLVIDSVSGNGEREFIKPLGVHQLTVMVTGGGAGTAWSYDLAPKPSSNSVTVAWSDPPEGYGSSVADYQVEWVELDENNNPLEETRQTSFTANRLRFVATGLNASTKYQFRLRAKLVTGTYGTWSEVSLHETEAS
jgi:hypothetical protein